jgi:predicted RNase H-like HicB family nuclease
MLEELMSSMIPAGALVEDALALGGYSQKQIKKITVKSYRVIVLIMFSEYIGAALRLAKYETLENGSYMATVEGLRGVIATGETIEKCREDLIEVIEEWIAIRLQRGFAIPSLEGHAIGVSQEPMAIV